jgi:hypothetical protein
MLISEDGQRELVKENVPDLGYRATPVLPELVGKACKKNPLAQIFVGRVSIRVLPRPR